MSDTNRVHGDGASDANNAFDKIDLDDARIAVPPVVIGPIVGPPITGIDGQVFTSEPPINGTDTTWTSPPVPTIPLDDLPDQERFVAPGMEGLYQTLAQAEPVPAPAHLEPYVAYSSPETPADPALYNIGQIVVKFVQDSAVRLAKRGVRIPREIAERPEHGRRGEVERIDDQTHVASFNALIADAKAVVARAASSVDVADLERLHRLAEANSGVEIPDPNLFFFVELRDTRPEAAAAVLGAVRDVPIVEAAYFAPIPVNATDIAPTTTIDVTPQQGYLRPAPGGIDVDMARRLPGGRGEDVRIADVEAGWRLDHEDLPPASFGDGINLQVFEGNHGTAVLGQLVAQENSYGAIGIAPAAAIGWSSPLKVDLRPFQGSIGWSVANALLATLRFLRPGDIALIEQHYPGPKPAATCTCNCTQYGYVAVETFPFEHAAITTLTRAGVVVVEAAGNGQTLVTPAANADSGAIVVGASNTALGPACFTNFGARVDVHAWGRNIGTLGYGTTFVTRLDPAGNVVLDASGNPIIDEVIAPSLRANGNNDSSQWYTRSFGGTSGASPIVTGAAALIQSTRAARGLDKLTSVEMRTLLRTTGTPQLPSTLSKPIGPQPNLAAALASYVPDSASFVRQNNAPAAIATGSTFIHTVTFKNTGSVPWAGYRMEIAPGDDGSYPWGTAQFLLGSTAAPVMPGDEVTSTFAPHAPAQPGTYALSYRLRTPLGGQLATSPRQYISVVIPTTTQPVTYDDAALTVTYTPGSVKVNASALVLITARNTGTTTWQRPTHALQLTRTGRIVIQVPSVDLAYPVVPGASFTFAFNVTGAATPGLGGVSMQMVGPRGNFGQGGGLTIVCQS